MTNATGDFTSVTTNGTATTETANAQNEITGVSGATTPTYDANGNMTGDQNGNTFTYDAWNRLVSVKSSSGTVLETNEYDGLDRLVAQTVGTTTTDRYYSSQDQVLEEFVSGAAVDRYVYSPVRGCGRRRASRASAIADCPFRRHRPRCPCQRRRRRSPKKERPTTGRRLRAASAPRSAEKCSGRCFDAVAPGGPAAGEILPPPRPLMLSPVHQ